jgi:hypothetical protein
MATDDFLDGTVGGDDAGAEHRTRRRSCISDYGGDLGAGRAVDAKATSWCRLFVQGEDWIKIWASEQRALAGWRSQKAA